MKKRIKLLSFIAVLVLGIIGVVCGSVIGVKHQEENGLVVTEKLTSNNLSLKMSRMSLRNTDQVQVTATISPSNATNKSLEWELVWNEQTTKKVSDYVTLDVSSTTLVCTLTFVKSFDISMSLIATSVSNPEITATCDVDCYERTQAITEIELNMSLNNSSSVTFRNEQHIDKTDEIIINGTNFENIFANEYVEINTFTGSLVKTGTLNTQSNCVYTIRLSDSLQDLLDNRNITYKSSSRVITTISIKNLLEELITFNSSNTEIIYEALNSTNNWFTITASITDSYASNIVHEYVTNFELTGFNISDYFESINTTGITLDKSEIIL